MIGRGALTLVTALWLAQGSKAARHKAPSHTATKKSAPAPKSTTADQTDGAAGDGGSAGASTGGDGAGAEGSGTRTAKTRVYTFGAMDVEGKLKTPQLLYFLDRVKLELEMSAPDKKSFMKELEESADDKNL